VLALDDVVDGGARTWAGTSLRFVVRDGGTLERILEILAHHDVRVERADVVVPDLDDVFVRLVERRSRTHTAPRMLARLAESASPGAIGDRLTGLVGRADDEPAGDTGSGADRDTGTDATDGHRAGDDR
jgi:hypothetical protein